MNNEVANLLIEYRKKENISQRELARRLEVDNAYIARIENGTIKKLSINLLGKISKELDISFFELLQISNYTGEEIEILQVFGDNINDFCNFVDDEIIKQYLIKDENGNIRISIIKILDDYKKEKININKTLGLLSCSINKNIYNYLTEKEIKKLENNKK